MTARKIGESPKGLAQGLELVSPEHRVERAAGDFRRGVPVRLAARGAINPNGGNGGADDGVIAVAVETVTDATLTALRDICVSPSTPSAKRAARPHGVLILTHARAATLKIRLYTPEVVGLALDSSMGVEALRAIADPTTDLAHPLKGPFHGLREALPKSAAASIKLAKLAGLLPATVIFRLDDSTAREFAERSDVSSVGVDAVQSFEARFARSLQLVVRARVPLEGAEICELAAFRARDGGPEHYAILIGAKDGAGLAPPGPVLTRLHSECFTGDLLGSLRCDCGDQLRGAVRTIAAAGGGVLLYLAQEGRGIGLMNKLRAYRLQDEGFDTLVANERLGFAADERLYDIAARMLTLLGYRAVRLMTNNLDKIEALKAAGIEVSERVPHSFPDNVHSRDYLKAKAEGGHLL